MGSPSRVIGLGAFLVPTSSLVGIGAVAGLWTRDGVLEPPGLLGVFEGEELLLLDGRGEEAQAVEAEDLDIIGLIKEVVSKDVFVFGLVHPALLFRFLPGESGSLGRGSKEQ